MKCQLSEERDILFIFKLKPHMNKKHFQSLLMIFIIGAAMITITARGNNLPDSIPKGWQAGARNPPDVIIGTDTSVRHSGKASGFILRPLALKPSTGTVVMLQSIDPGPYRNKKVKLTVYARSKDMEAGAFFYFRVDGEDSVLAYANTARNMIEETNEWTLCHITLDVTEAAIALDFGVVWSRGQGTIWMDDFNLEVVDNLILSEAQVITGQLKYRGTKKRSIPNAKAMNLGFEEKY